MAEVPSVTGVEGDFPPGNNNEPYRRAASSNEDIFIDASEVNTKLHMISAECESFLRDCHSASRRKASEVLVFILSDTDRMKSSARSNHSSIVAYGMKGNSLPVNQLRDMIDDIRGKAQSYGVRIVCECFDGQWAKLCFKTANGLPLTLLELQKQSWAACRDLTHNGIVARLQDLCHVKRTDLDNIQQIGRCDFSIQSGNLQYEVERVGSRRVLVLSSCGGHLSRDGAMARVNLSNVNVTAQELKCIKVGEGKSKVRGLQANENNLLCTLPQHILDEVWEEMETALDVEDDIPDELTLPDLEPPMTALERLLSSDKFPLIDEIYNTLKNTYPDHWKKLKRKDVYPGLLTDGTKLFRDSRHWDLNLIADTVTAYNGRPLFYRKDKKEDKVKAIIKVFGSNDIFTGDKPKVLSLKDMCLQRVRTIPPLLLQVVYANVVHSYNKETFYQGATVEMEAYIPVLDANVPMFSFPEHNPNRDELMPRLMDYTHQLTNLRSIVCRKGIENVRREAFWEVAERFPRVISKAAVCDVLDKQSASIALNMFSEEVQQCLQLLGHTQEAFFTRVVREWHCAMDQRSIPANQRVNWLWQMYAYLTKDVDFDRFPAPGSYVKGIPVVTYAGILQGICTRIQGYKFCRRQTFNSRVMSSMECETLFSWMTVAEPTGTGCPKAADMPKIVSDMLTVQDYRSRQDRKFFLKAAYRTIYPVKQVMQQNSSDSSDTCTTAHQPAYKNHDFDNPVESRRKKRPRKKDVTFGDAPLKGVQSTRRRFFKIDESTVNPYHFPQKHQ